MSGDSSLLGLATSVCRVYDEKGTSVCGTVLRVTSEHVVVITDLNAVRHSTSLHVSVHHKNPVDVATPKSKSKTKKQHYRIAPTQKSGRAYIHTTLSRFGIAILYAERRWWDTEVNVCSTKVSLKHHHFCYDDDTMEESRIIIPFYPNPGSSKTRDSHIFVETNPISKAFAFPEKGAVVTKLSCQPNPALTGSLVVRDSDFGLIGSGIFISDTTRCFEVPIDIVFASTQHLSFQSEVLPDTTSYTSCSHSLWWTTQAFQDSFKDLFYTPSNEYPSRIVSLSPSLQFFQQKSKTLFQPGDLIVGVDGHKLDEDGFVEIEYCEGEVLSIHISRLFDFASETLKPNGQRMITVQIRRSSNLSAPLLQPQNWNSLNINITIKGPSLQTKAQLEKIIPVSPTTTCLFFYDLVFCESPNSEQVLLSYVMPLSQPSYMLEKQFTIDYTHVGVKSIQSHKIRTIHDLFLIIQTIYASGEKLIVLELENGTLLSINPLSSNIKKSFLENKRKTQHLEYRFYQNIHCIAWGQFTEKGVETPDEMPVEPLRTYNSNTRLGESNQEENPNSKPTKEESKQLLEETMYAVGETPPSLETVTNLDEFEFEDDETTNKSNAKDVGPPVSTQTQKDPETETETETEKQDEVESVFSNLFGSPTNN
ncbi:MAG: hypothetical protein ACTSUE_00230 [Promethearchaeota archaeon]